MRPKQSGSAWTVSIVHGASAGPYRRGGTGYGKGATAKSSASSSPSASSFAFSASVPRFVRRDLSSTEPACVNRISAPTRKDSDAHLGRAPARQRNRADGERADGERAGEPRSETSEDSVPFALSVSVVLR